MNKKIATMVLLALLGLSLLQMGTVYAGRSVTVNVPAVNLPATNPSTTKEIKGFPSKIEPEIFKILEGGKVNDIPVVDGIQYLPIYIVANKDITQFLERMPKIRIVGKTEITGILFYLALVPIEPDSSKVLIKIASLPEVESITRTNPFKPIGKITDPEVKSSKQVEKVSINVPRITRNLDMTKFKKFEVKTLKMPEVMKMRKNSPLRQGEFGIAARDIPSQPADYFAIYHHGSLTTWQNLGITGAGISVAVIDSGVDFGNPDLQDAYAVEMNPNSPYYGWPVAYSGHSMIWYLIMNMTFPNYIYSWYADTSIELPYFFVYGNVSVGYKGNFTTVFTSMSLANIQTDSERAAFINETLSWIGITNETKVLLVDDDGNETIDQFYKAALNLLNITYDVYEVLPADADGPNATVLNNYDLIIWFTGGAYNNTLTPADITNLEAYLDNGGKLWMISQDLLEETPMNSTFVKEYLHIVNVDPDYPVPTIVQTANGAYRAGSIYYGLYGSLTDAFADFISPDTESQVLAVGYEAVVALRWIDPETNETTEITFMKFPLSENLTVPTKSGIFHFGLHPDLALWADWNGGYIIVADPENATKYDTVYADITPLVIESGNITLDYVDFNEDVGHTKDNPIIQVDFWDSGGETFGTDGYADLSGGMIYFIADGVNPIPYSDVVAERWGLNLEIPKNGNLVAFMIGTAYIGGGDHGTLCAAAVAARGRTFYGLTFGTAIDSKIIAEGSLYSGGSWLDYVFFAVEGYDGTPGTGDEALVVSNSYGASSIINKGFTWDDRFLYFITHLYAPWTTFLFAAGNGGPGYGTVTSEGASPGVITVGAAVEWGYRALFGYDDGPWGYELANYGDVADFSNRGPNTLGQPDPEVLAVGEYALGSLPLNEVGDGFWSADLWGGTSLATPMAAGIAALVYQAYIQTHGTLPTAEEVKEILMSTAKNVNHDVFSQGAGFLDAYRAVQVAMNLDGVVVSPSSWQAGTTEYPAFPNVIYPGESVSKTFTIKNANVSDEKNVTISAEVFKKIGEVEIEVVGNSWQMYKIDQYIPEDAELMKITLYTEYSNFDPDMNYYSDAYPWFRVWDVTYVNGTPTLNLLQQSAKEGTVASAMLGSPRKKFHDEMWVQIRDLWRYYGKSDTYPAKLKIEFFKRVPWDWVKIDNTTLTVPAGGSANFTAILTVPEDTPYGIYEGAIYVKYDGTEITIPVSVVVASPSENFKFGGERVANGLYDNSNVYGYFDWGWRYESGDWRLFYFNVTEEGENGTYLITDISWSGLLNDINLHVLGPVLDSWSYNIPDVFGPYTLEEVARSDDGYVTAGIFKWQTTSGTSRELIAAPLSRGLHALWLHNVLFDGKTISATFEGEVGVAKVMPYQWVEETPLPSGSREFLFTKSLDIGHITVEAYGLVKPQVYKDQLAPETDDSDYYYIAVNNSALLDVKITSEWDDLAGVDLDLYVYYYDEEHDNYIMVGSSTTPTSDEEVKVKFPKDGLYVIEVNAWDNPAYGQATYNLSILSLEKKGNLFAEIEEMKSNTYKIKASYRLKEDEYKEGGTYIGAIFIGSQYNPMLIEVPVKVTVNPKQIVVHGESVRVREEATKIININLTTVKLVGALQLRFRYDPAILKIEEITVPDVLKDQVTLESNINNTAGVAEIGLMTLAGLGNVTALNIEVFGVNEGNTTIGIEVVDASDVRGMKMSAVGMPIKVEVYHRMKGDANDDDKITAVDALIYLRFAVGLDISPYHLDPVEDDVTGDGKITAVDALKVLRAAVGLEKLS